MSTFSVKAAADLTSVARPSIRLYTTKFSRYFSTEATPGPGEPRMLTEADLKLIRYIFEQTSTGLTHTQVQAKLDAGELDDFEWEIPSQADEFEQEQQSTALLPPDLVRATQVLVEEYRRRAEEGALREREMQEEIKRLERELGEARGRLDEVRKLRYRAPAWFRSVFGGRPD